jgi:hypothetical protein
MSFYYRRLIKTNERSTFESRLTSGPGLFQNPNKPGTFSSRRTFGNWRPRHALREHLGIYTGE